ncbi:hypothetical protein MRB53_015686 [Persea americana]|uniref:Uncharacterized protein n=1 Tax=Persea americana TaxID=3435 RepID=A0ACC2LZY4_PERAE|nr:hypothetical protein MRB53_015686 [Persea americana]
MQLELVHSDVFGRIKDPSIGGSKFDKKAIRCIFVGYDSERKAWRCIDPSTNRPYISRNVVFDEASAWRSSYQVPLPNSQIFDDELQERINLEFTPEPEVVEQHHELSGRSMESGLRSVEPNQEVGEVSPSITSEQTTDMFTKGLCHSKFSKFTKELGIVHRDLALRGSVGSHCQFPTNVTSLVMSYD